MKPLARALAFCALALVILPPVAFMFRAFTDEAVMKILMLVGTVLWFSAAPLWLRAAPAPAPDSRRI